MQTHQIVGEIGKPYQQLIMQTSGSPLMGRWRWHCGCMVDFCLSDGSSLRWAKCEEHDPPDRGYDDPVRSAVTNVRAIGEPTTSAKNQRSSAL
jgi:hypothetical protein